MACVLVTGGAGYIGSHFVKTLQEVGAEVVVVDDLSAGHADAVKGVVLHHVSVGDMAALEGVFSSHSISSVVHFAGRIEAGHSVRDPRAFYRANVGATLTLLDVMRRHDVDRLVFSSSAAVYGRAVERPIPETALIAPINPYGRTKAQVEQIIADIVAAEGMKAVCLRYFNAAGAHEDATIGERHKEETHLIPLALLAVMGSRPRLQVYGNDYKTPDGTCIRDYVHVSDLADAHLAALRLLDNSSGFHVFNVGAGRGYSNLEVLETISRICGRDVPYEFSSRRPGDPDELVAAIDRITQATGWRATRSELGHIIETAWAFHSAHQTSLSATRHATDRYHLGATARRRDR